MWPLSLRTWNAILPMQDSVNCCYFDGIVILQRFLWVWFCFFRNYSYVSRVTTCNMFNRNCSMVTSGIVVTNVIWRMWYFCTYFCNKLLDYMLLICELLILYCLYIIYFEGIYHVTRIGWVWVGSLITMFMSFSVRDLSFGCETCDHTRLFLVQTV